MDLMNVTILLICIALVLFIIDKFSKLIVGFLITILAVIILYYGYELIKTISIWLTNFITELFFKLMGVQVNIPWWVMTLVMGTIFTFSFVTYLKIGGVRR